jgi:hypothetical protein
MGACAMTIKQLDKLLRFRVEGVDMDFYHGCTFWVVRRYLMDPGGYIDGPGSTMEWGKGHPIPNFKTALRIAKMQNDWLANADEDMREAAGIRFSISHTYHEICGCHKRIKSLKDNLKLYRERLKEINLE